MLFDQADIEIERSPDGISVVALLGEHDLKTAPRLASAIARELEAGQHALVDLTHAAFIDGSTLNTLAAARHTALSAGRELVLQNGAAYIVQRVIEISRIAIVIPTATDREQAITLLRHPVAAPENPARPEARPAPPSPPTEPCSEGNQP